MEVAPLGERPGPDEAPCRGGWRPRPRARQRAGTATSAWRDIPFNRQSPFYVGFVGALGVLTAYAVVQAIGRLDTTITLLIVSLFLTLALNPLVEGLTATEGAAGGSRVAIVFLGLLAVFPLFGMVWSPSVAAGHRAVRPRAPECSTMLAAQPVVRPGPRPALRGHPTDPAGDQRRVADGNLWAGIFGGVLDAGKIIASGVFSVLTVLRPHALLPRISALGEAGRLRPRAGQPAAPASSRSPRRSCAASGPMPSATVAVAATNAFFAWIMMSLLDVPFAAVLAVAVGLLGARSR